MPLSFRQSVIEYIRQVIHVRQVPQAQRRLEHSDGQNAGPVPSVAMRAAISYRSHDNGITKTKFDGRARVKGLVDFYSKSRLRYIDYSCAKPDNRSRIDNFQIADARGLKSWLIAGIFEKMARFARSADSRNCLVHIDVCHPNVELITRIEQLKSWNVPIQERLSVPNKL